MKKGYDSKLDYLTQEIAKMKANQQNQGRIKDISNEKEFWKSQALHLRDKQCSISQKLNNSGNLRASLHDRVRIFKIDLTDYFRI